MLPGLCAAAAAAQQTLSCGQPLLDQLTAGGTDTYRVAAAPGAAIQIQASAVSMPLGAIRLTLSGADGFAIDTCTGVVQFTGPAEDLTLQVSQCFGSTGGSYTLALNVVSDDATNCGHVLPCGATPDGTGFSVPGQVDSYQVALAAGQTAVFKTNYLAQSGFPLLSLYDPQGNLVSPGRCAGTTSVQPPVSGTYTALVSACGPPMAPVDYRIEVYQPGCPVGPTITHFGIIDTMNRLVGESDVDAAGRPIYTRPLGEAWFLVVEARGGHDSKQPGPNTVPYELGDEDEDPDLQVIVSRDLGNGDPAVCDVTPPNLGGVPATVPFDFNSDESDAADHIADMGCRFRDGMGRPLGITDPIDACTFTGQNFGYSFVDRGSSIQYCGNIETAWAFPTGDTIVAARVKDGLGNFGEPREIVVRVASTTPTIASTPPPTNTPPSVLPTETSTRTPRTPTRTRTPTPTGPTPTPPLTPIGGTPTPGLCVGDCEGAGSVSVNDLVRMVNIAVGSAPISDCSAGDADNDGAIEIPELVQAVTYLLNGCPTGSAD